MSCSAVALSQVNQAVPRCDFAQTRHTQNPALRGVVPRFGPHELKLRMIGDIVERGTDVDGPDAIEWEIGASWLPEQSSPCAQTSLGTQIVKRCNGMAAPRGVPVGPAHIGPTVGSKHASDLVDDIKRVGGVFEDIRTENTVEFSIFKGQLPGIGDHGAGRHLTVADEFGQLKIGCDDRGTKPLERPAVVALTASEVEYALTAHLMGKRLDRAGRELEVEGVGNLAIVEKQPNQIACAQPVGRGGHCDPRIEPLLRCSKATTSVASLVVPR